MLLLNVLMVDVMVEVIAFVAIAAAEAEYVTTGLVDTLTN